MSRTIRRLDRRRTPSLPRGRDGERTSLPGQHPFSNDKEACATNLCALSVVGNETKEAVFFVSDSGGEVSATPQWKKIPQAIKLQRRAIGLPQRLDEVAGRRIVNVNESVTEIPDPKFAVLERESPRGVEIAL